MAILCDRFSAHVPSPQIQPLCRLSVLMLTAHPQPLCLSSPKALSQKVVTEAACIVCQQIIRMVSNIPLLGAFLNPCTGNPKALLIFVTC